MGHESQNVIYEQPLIHLGLGIYLTGCVLHCTLLKTGKGCVTTEILIIGFTRPTSSIFKPKSTKGVALGTMVETVQDIRFSHWGFYR